MKKFSVDYQHLDQDLNHEKCFRLKDVQHKLQKVAFDVVRFIDSDNIDGLWQIKRNPDGEYIVAMYEEAAQLLEQAVTKSSCDWSVIADKSNEKLNIFYKTTPVTKISLASLSIPIEDADLVCSYLPQKLATEPKLVTGLLADLSFQQQRHLVTQHPELGCSEAPSLSKIK